MGVASVYIYKKITRGMAYFMCLQQGVSESIGARRSISIDLGVCGLVIDIS